MANYKKRADGRYCTRIYLGRDNDGKKKFKYIYAKTPTELKKLEREQREKMEKGVDLLRLNDTFAQWLERTKAVKKIEQNASEYSIFCARAQAFLPAIGDLSLPEVSVALLQSVINEITRSNPRTGKPSAKKTVQRYLTAASNVFEYAIANRAADYNPCKYVKIPKQAGAKERRALETHERKRIEEFDHPGRFAAMLLLYSGLRLGEATALLWSDIDLDEGTIRVNKSYDFKAHELKTPKTASGTRIVSIPDKLTVFLKAAPRSGIYVVTNPASGGMMTDKAWRKLWDAYIKAMVRHYDRAAVIDEDGTVLSSVVEPFTPHYLRHTFCSLMYLAGVDVLTAKEQMGHKDIQTTLKIYTHLDRIYKKTNIQKLNDFLEKQVDETA